jgi:acetyl esterase
VTANCIGRGLRPGSRIAPALLAVSIVAISLSLPAHGYASGEPVVAERDISYAGPGGPAMDVFHAPSDPATRPAVMVIHGGGWIGRDRSRTEPIALALANAGFVAFNVDFTLSTRRRPAFRRQPRDLRSAIRYMRANAEQFGVDPARIGVFGSSSGAHLAALVAMTGRGPLDTGSRVRAVVSWGGLYKLRGLRLPRRLRQRTVDLLGCRRCPRRAASASPLHHVSRDDPAAMIVHSWGEKTPLFQARWMARRLRRVGVPRRLLILRGNHHIPSETSWAFRRTVSFLRRHLR